MTAVAPAPSAPPSPAPPAPHPALHGSHSGPRPSSDFDQVLDRLPHAAPKDDAPTPKEKPSAPKPSNPSAPQAGAETWAGLWALSYRTASEPLAALAPAPARCSTAMPTPIDPKQPPPARPAEAAPNALARLMAARAFLAPSGAVPPALAASADTFVVPAAPVDLNAPAAAAQPARTQNFNVAPASGALGPQVSSLRPAIPARTPLAGASAGKTETPSPTPLAKPAAARRPAPDSGSAPKPQPAAADGAKSPAAASANARGDAPTIGATAAVSAGDAAPAPGLAAPQWPAAAAPNVSNAPAAASPTPTQPSQAPVLSAGRLSPAPVREIDVDLAPSGLEDVSMTMRLQGERLSLVIRAASGQTASTIEGAREAIAESMAAIGQPLASLVVERTSPSPERNGASNGDQSGERRPGAWDDPRGGRRGASRSF